MKGDKALPPKGTRDFGPEVMAKRNWIIEKIRSGYKKFGFEELQTPAMESLSVLLGKYGLEGEKLIYKILNSGNYLNRDKQDGVKASDLDQGENKLTQKISEKGLRYDLTVPFARFVANHHNELSFPFKRHQIQPVWRADRPQKGRFREFLQCDADTVGSSSPLTDAELIIMAHEILYSLGINSFSFQINHRKILGGVCQELAPNIPQEKILGTIDKIDKIGQEKVVSLLSELGISEDSLNRLNQFLGITSTKGDGLIQVQELFANNEEVRTGVDELNRLFSLVSRSDSKLDFNPSLARGLDYYTGAIFEITIPNSGIGSICGGGRYDNLTGIFGVEGIPGVGLSFGLDRIYEYFDQNDLFPDSIKKSVDYLICHVDAESMLPAWELWKKISSSGLKGYVFPEESKMKKQFQYADRNNIPFVIVVGPEEIEADKYQLKNLNSGEQVSLTIEELVNKMKSN